MPSPTNPIPKKQEIYESSTTNTQLPPPTTTRTFTFFDLLLPLALILILMASTMPGFISRLFRPFTTSTSLGISAGGAGGATPLSVPEGAQKATIAAGCFWGVEHMYRKQFGGKGLYDARVGYIGGNTKNPSYQAVCREGTGHAEALQVTYDPAQITYRQLLEFFYKMHDPTTTNQQGPDRGTQYRSGIFYHDDEQKSIAEEITKKVNEKWWKGKVVTEILPAGEWWDAEQYHQLYLDKNPGGYECPSHFLRKFPDLE